MTKPLVIFASDGLKRHSNGPSSPECEARYDVLMDMIQTDFPTTPIERSFPANEDDILCAHPQSYLDDLLDNTPFEGYYAIDGDTALNPDSYECALLSAGTAIQATRHIIEGHAQTAFALCRPPGHHAEYHKAMGYCFFNNAFIAAAHSGVKTLIIDFDVHHGNGTQDLVERRVKNGQTDIAYASIHHGDIFPFTGTTNATNICNVNLSAGDGSSAFRNGITHNIFPFATDFAPDLIIFSAGFDGHSDDDIADIHLQHDDYEWITHQIKPLCPRIVSVLEGGYNLQTLPQSAKHHLKGLASR